MYKIRYTLCMYTVNFTSCVTVHLEKFGIGIYLLSIVR